MFLLISIGFAILYAILKPFGDGLFDTSLWLSKIMMPVDFDESQITKQFLKGNQAALLGSRLSNFPFVNTLAIVGCIVFGSIYMWWMGIVVAFIAIFIGVLLKRIFTRPVVHYIIIIYHSLLNRAANYRRENDIERAEAAESFYKELEEIITIYKKSSAKPPTAKEIKSNPTGDIFYWIQAN